MQASPGSIGAGRLPGQARSRIAVDAPGRRGAFDRRGEEAAAAAARATVPPVAHARPPANARQAQTWANPPSTKTSLPVMKLLSSEARNSAVAATSSARPIRPNGSCAVMLSMIASCWPVLDSA